MNEKPDSAPGQDELDRAEGEGMTEVEQEKKALALAAGELSAADKLAAGETVEVGGILVKNYEKANSVSAEPPAPQPVTLEQVKSEHSSLVSKVADLAERCGIALMGDAHSLVGDVGKYVDGLHRGVEVLKGDLYRARKVSDVLAASHEPVPDGVYDNSVTEFREWYVGDKLQVSIAKERLGFLGNTVPQDLRGNWGTKPDVPGHAEAA